MLNDHPLTPESDNSKWEHQIPIIQEGAEPRETREAEPQATRDASGNTR
jgi:hypothetical protein